MFHETISGLRDVLDASGGNILNNIVEAIYVELMDWSGCLDKVLGTNDPSTSHASGWEYFTSRVDADASISHAFLEGHFG